MDHKVLVQQYLANKEQLGRIYARQRYIRDLLEGCELPKKRRPATPADVVVDAVLWYERGDDGPFCTLVFEVYGAADNFKGYCDELSGSRYGLDGAYVEIVS
jgi:hypothetical protein